MRRSDDRNLALTAKPAPQAASPHRFRALKRGAMWAAGILLLLSALPWGARWAASSPMPFDRDVWVSSGAPNGEGYPRRFMADEFIQNDSLKGLTKPQILEMLGDPGDHGYFKDYDLVYWLGPERTNFEIDSEWLVMRIGAKTGTVEEYRLITD